MEEIQNVTAIELKKILERIEKDFFFKVKECEKKNPIEKGNKGDIKVRKKRETKVQIEYGM